MDDVVPRRRDDESGQYTDAYGDSEFLDAIRDNEVAGSGEIAEAVGCTRRHALNRLRELEEEGRVRSKMVGNSLIWMPPE